MENDILDSLNDLGYEGPLNDEVAFAKALDGGPKSLEFTKLIHILAEELKKLCHLEEAVSVMNSPDESSSFLLELSSFLKELGCPYKCLVTGHMSSRLQSKEDRLLLLDYMISELMAARMVRIDCPKEKQNSGMAIIMQESPTAKDLKDILISLKFNKPPPNITPEMLFSKLETKLKDTLQKEGDKLVGKPLYNKALSEKDWKNLESTYSEMYEEYRLRRETLITRLECTIQSCEWSDRLKSKKDTIQSVYRPKREALKVKPDVKLSDFLAARTALLQVEKTSSASVRKNTQSDVNKVLIGQVPDRGGRPNEQQPPPPEMPSWQQRSGPQGGGGRGGGRGGGDVGRGGPRGGRGGGGRVQGGYSQATGQEQARPQTSPAAFNQNHRNYQTYEVPPGGYSQNGGYDNRGGYDSRGGYDNRGGHDNRGGYSQGYNSMQQTGYDSAGGYQGYQATILTSGAGSVESGERRERITYQFFMDNPRSKKAQQLGPYGKPKGTSSGSLKGKLNKTITPTPRKSSASVETRSLLATQPTSLPRAGETGTLVNPNQPPMGVVAAPADTAQPFDRLQAGWTLVEPRGRKRDKPRPGASHPQPEPGDSLPHRPSQRKRRQARLRALDDQIVDPPAPLAKTVRFEPQPNTSQGIGGASTVGKIARPTYKKASNERGLLSDKIGCEAKSAVKGKRSRFDETESPRGEHKRPRLLKRPQPTSNADAAKTDPLVAVTSETTGHICAESLQLVQKKLEEKLMAAMIGAKGGDEGPSFQGKPIRDGGALKLWCSNLSTLDWLKSAVEDIVFPNGDRLAVKQIWKLPRRIRCGILLPGVLKDSKAIGGMLSFQNPWAEVDRWLLHALHPQATNTFIVVSVPEELVPALMVHERRLSYMLGSVYLKFQGPNGKFTETSLSQFKDREESGDPMATEPIKNLQHPTPMAAIHSEEPAGNDACPPEPSSSATSECGTRQFFGA